MRKLNRAFVLLKNKQAIAESIDFVYGVKKGCGVGKFRAKKIPPVAGF